jgi:DNA ligase-1
VQTNNTLTFTLALALALPLPLQPHSNYSYASAHEPDVWLDAVCCWEVKCADLSISPAHTGGAGKVHPTKGIGLRFPRFLRVRDDKPVEMATNAEQVADMYRSQDNIVDKDSSGVSLNIDRDEEDGDEDLL